MMVFRLKLNEQRKVKRDKLLPTMIEKRLSSIACDENKFTKVAPTYNKALKKSGYKHTLVFQATKTKKPRNRKRNITWFNSPPLAITFRPM